MILKNGTLRGYAWDRIWDSPYVDLRVSLYRPLWGNLAESLYDGLWSTIKRDLQEKITLGLDHF